MPFYRPFWFTCLLGAALSYPLLQPLHAIAQSALPACPPPASQEYLLLVRGKTEAERAQIASVLPSDNTVLVCQYLDEVVVRAGGFTSLETANAWATYMTTVAGFESFVSRPAAAEQVAAASTTTEVGGASNGDGANEATYQPQRLGAGYAVLVEYGDRPEVATTVGQVVRPVGLAVYQQRSYLLADYTGDADSAAITLQRLSDAQLAAILVDAQQVVRLSAEVAR
ncbi:hypothetical protein [Leptolyngbya sp. BC1307]|uniref:hypothetical protein n=1 Tax=Leptolyngbya sp. BC1307 TaxID=2029589 RepID=UPI000EFB7D91|nr:hypothetical protein [Leptolyngbya sp. BC1307]